MSEKVLDMQEEEKKKESVDSTEQQKEDVAKIFGISLTNIEHVILPNKKEYFKFYNPADNTLRMIENRSDGKNLGQQFKELQKEMSFSQGDNEMENARAIFDFHLKYLNIELNLIPIKEFENNKQNYRYLIDGLDEGKRKSVRALLEVVSEHGLTHINIENAIAIDNGNKVVSAEYDHQTGKCKIVNAEVRNHDNQKLGAGEEGYTITISDDEFDAAVDMIDIANDEPVVTEAEEIGNVDMKKKDEMSIKGKTIQVSSVLKYYQYPELINQDERLSDVERYIYTGIIAALVRKQQKNRSNGKQYVLTNNNKNQAAFIDSMFLSLMLGFFSGLLFATIILAIRANI